MMGTRQPLGEIIITGNLKLGTTMAGIEMVYPIYLIYQSLFKVFQSLVTRKSMREQIILILVKHIIRMGLHQMCALHPSGVLPDMQRVPFLIEILCLPETSTRIRPSRAPD